MRLWVNNVTVDCRDAAALAEFYAALLGREVVRRGGSYVVVGLGATRGDHVAELGMTWRRMTDPEGNPFCVSRRPA